MTTVPRMIMMNPIALGPKPCAKIRPTLFMMLASSRVTPYSRMEPLVCGPMVPDDHHQKLTGIDDVPRCETLVLDGI
jgi:hypothetical protein